MSNMPSSLENSERDDPLDPKRALSAEALQRRRMLLKGAGGGGAALAALTPLSALAGNQLMFCKNKTKTGNVIATVSGVNSAAASFAGRPMPPEAAGCSANNWGGKANSAWPCDQGLFVKDVITWASCPKYTTFIQLMKNTTSYQTERHWLCAYVNAVAHEKGKLPLGYSFPYTSLEVKQYILNQDSKAYAFFSGYMEAL